LGISRSPLASGLRKVRAMPTDLGFWIVMGAFFAAVVVFVVGWVRQRRLEGRELAMDMVAEAVNRPPLPGSETVVNTPYATPREETAPLSDAGTAGWWRISTTIYRGYDLVLMLIVAGVYLLPLFLELFLGKQEVPKLTMEMALGTIVMQFFMVAVVIGCVAWRQKPAIWLGLRWRMWPLVIPISIVGVLLTWGVLGILQMTQFFEWLQGLLGNDGKQEVVKAFTETNDPLLLGTLVILAVVVAPLTEEILFRGYLYPVAKRFIGRGAAVIFGALIFAVLHHNAQALIPLFVLGVLLTLAYEFTGSIWAPIGIHTLFNGATVAVQLAIKYGLMEAPAT
jgi:membrane protease YdiL (CAAX protease family)